MKRLLIFAAIALMCASFAGCAKRPLDPEQAYRPNALSPAQNDVKNVSRIFFDWSVFPDANGYKILLWHGDTLIWEREEFTSSVKCARPVTNGNYRWCVGVRVGNGDYEKWSDTIDFVVEQTPFIVRSWAPTKGFAQDCAAIDGYVYAADGQAGYTVIDARNLDALSFISNLDWNEQDDCRSVIVDRLSNLLILGDYRGRPTFMVADITNRATPTIVPNTVFANRTADICGFRMRDTFFVAAADDDDGLTIFDFGTTGYITVRGDPFGRREGEYGAITGVSAKDTLIATAVGDAGISIINVRNPNAKQLVGHCDTPGDARRLRFFGNYIYVADGIGGLAVVDATDARAPIYITSTDMQTGDARDLEILQIADTPFLALATGSGGVLLYDLTLPAQPCLVGRIETPYAYGIGIGDECFFIADRDWGIVAITLR